ncbi:dual specificity protein phosphatase MPK-4 isoform X2 [Hyalella azteca]|uniref:protein-tyrosine-phosphatase n=1 Tax=Hyalella azteca TaxID=294128 RepID=A0A979FRY2_HYAAZ|nr:dual specificity protein phosphatase MPK-4 isoform X2 [Hyalella azteca]
MTVKYDDDGNLSTAASPATLSKLHITHVLTVASESLPLSLTQKMPYIIFHYIQVDDIPGSDLLSHFESSCNFIAEGQAMGAVLVHCYFGVSRSATLVAAHLMRKHKLNWHQALDRIRSRRRCVGPNVGFLHQLDLFHALQWKLDAHSKLSPLFRLYKHKMLCTRIRTEPHRLKEFLTSYLELFQDDSHVNRNPGLSCRSCRAVLCSRACNVQHCHGCWPALENGHSNKVCERSFYMTAQPWMLSSAYTSKMAGNLKCPKCSKEIGRFHWLRDLPCACREVVPCVACVADGEVDAGHISLDAGSVSSC